MARLTALKIKGLVKPGRYGDGDGLWLQVRSPTNRSWLFRYKVTSRAHQMGLGPLSDVSLAEARELARKCRNQLREGLDPLALRRAAKDARRAAAEVLTFGEVADRYLAAHEPAWTNPKHVYQWRQTLGIAKAQIGKRQVSAIGTGEVLRVLEPIWREKPETASRLRGRIESVLDFATARGWRTGDNPARWRGHLDKLLPAPGKVARIVHQPALPWREVGAFMAELETQQGIAALALRFVILTAARTGEAIGATWSEIDLAEAVWSVPAARMKMRKPHRVPLSDAALAVLELVSPLKVDDSDPVFPGGREGRGLSNMAMLALLRRMNPQSNETPARWRDGVTGDPISVHGFRSCFRDWAAESTNYPREVAEAALAHAVPDAVEASYRRGDLFEKRRQLMAAWAKFCAQRPAAREVIPIRA